MSDGGIADAFNDAADDGDVAGDVFGCRAMRGADVSLRPERDRGRELGVVEIEGWNRGAPGGAEAFLGFPCPTVSSVGSLAHARNVGFGGCEIASAVGLSAKGGGSVCTRKGGDVNRDAYPALSCSLSAISCVMCCSVISDTRIRLSK